MTNTCTNLTEELRHDFSRARRHLSHARHLQAEKDTPVNRAAVAEWLSCIDAVLDMYLNARQLPL